MCEKDEKLSFRELLASRPFPAEDSTTKNGDRPPLLDTEPTETDRFLSIMRAELADLETRFQRTLTSLFQKLLLPWDEWMVSCSSESSNRTALGIPVHQTQEDIVRMLGARRGLSKSFHELLARRLDVIFQMVARTLNHPLCAQAFDPFKALVEDLRKSLTDRDGTAYNRLRPDTLKDILDKSDWRRALTPYFHTFYDPEAVLLLEQLFQSHQSVKQSNDSKLVPITLLQKIIELNPLSFQDVTFLWYYGEELFSATGTDAPWQSLGNIDSDVDARRRLQRYHNQARDAFLNKTSNSPGANARLFNFGGLEEFLEYPSSQLVDVSTALLAYGFPGGYFQDVPTATSFDESKKAARKCLRSFFSDHGESALFYQSDNGHLFFVALRLFVAYELFKYDHCYWAKESVDTQREFWECKFMESKQFVLRSEVETHPNYYICSPEDSGSKWARPLAQLFVKHADDKKAAAKQGAAESEYLPIMKAVGTSKYNVETVAKEDSVMVLGGAGLGKTHLLKTWYKGCKHENFVQMTPMDLPADVVEALRLSNKDIPNGSSKLKMCRAYLRKYQRVLRWVVLKNRAVPKILGRPHLVLFVDEIHIEDAGNPFAKLLIPLEDGISVETGHKDPTAPDKKTRDTVQAVRFVFATSKYRTKAEFLAAAIATNNTPMWDFATRIGHWIELPPLSTLPEQRALLSWLGFEKAEHTPDCVRSKYLDLRLKSARDLKRPYAPNDSTPNVFPVWVEKLVMDVPRV